MNWSLKTIEWDNLFNYGENNKIDFDKLNGIVGIFGKSFSGKSSIVDSLLYTLIIYFKTYQKKLQHHQPKQRLWFRSSHDRRQ